MKTNRRSFVGQCGLLAGATVLGSAEALGQAEGKRKRDEIICVNF